MLRADALVARLWGDEGGWAGMARTVLSPFELLFAVGGGVRRAAYDAGVLRPRPLGLPAVSVGNLTVGGTGKTPVSAWLARRLAAAGARPAILLRGYGDDEPAVHRRLTPAAVVVADADRVRGAAAARAAGATVAVLDDAFQHRRAARDADLVLLSADAWTGGERLLPAGPWREPLSALRRATGVVVTRKAADPARAARVVADLRARGYGLPAAVVHLAAGALVDARTGAPATPPPAPGMAITALSAIGAPAAFEAQLVALGFEVIGSRFPDHHPYTAADLATVAALGRPVVCTLKDAVKAGDRWPASGPPLWYLSQTVAVEEGAAWLDSLVARLAASARP